MAIRKFPISPFGKLPELDDRIKKGPNGTFILKSNPEQKFRTVTPARMAAAQELGLKDKYPESALITERHWPDKIKKLKVIKKGVSKRKTPSKTTVTKQTKKTTRQGPTAEAPNHPMARQPVEMHSAHRPHDPFDSANRIFIRIPIGHNSPPAELSVPKNIDEKDLATTLKVLKELKS